MQVEFLQSTDDLRRVQKQMRRRVANLKFDNSDVQVTRSAGMFKARFAGSTDVAFGETAAEAKQRLRKLPNMVRSSCTTKLCDLEADRAEAAVERAAEKAARRSVKYDPKGNR